MDIKKIDLNLLVALDALLRARSVTGAARMLGMSQPAMSAAAARLRKMFGVPLFVRTSHGIDPTPFAESLGGTLRDVLDRIRSDLLQPPVFDPSTARGTITLNMHDVGELVFLPRIVELLARAAPGLDVATVDLPTEQIEPALRSGAVDLVLGSFPDLDGAALYQQRLFAHSFVCVVRADHRAAGRELTRRQYLEAQHGIVHAPGALNDALEAELGALGIQRSVRVRIGHYLAVPMLLRKSDLVFTVPEAIGRGLASFADVRVVDLPFQVKKPVVRQHWHSRYGNDERTRWLRGVIAEQFMESARNARRAKGKRAA